MSAKVILGDKFGNIHLLDASRKSILDKKEILKYKGRRIISIATCCIEWVDTRLVYFAVVQIKNLCLVGKKSILNRAS